MGTTMAAPVMGARIVETIGPSAYGAAPVMGAYGAAPMTTMAAPVMGAPIVGSISAALPATTFGASVPMTTMAAPVMGAPLVGSMSMGVPATTVTPTAARIL